MPLYDKTGREILENDVLKVYHFTGARKKKYYMYKQALGFRLLGPLKLEYREFSHLDRSGEKYIECNDGRTLHDYEIVQGFGTDGISYEDRPRKPPTQNEPDDE